jgi:hypothetical protein
MTPPVHNYDDLSGRSSREIEQTIRERRGKMDETLGELGARLTLRSLIHNVLDWWDEGTPGRGGSTAARRAAKSLARQIKNHPMPSLLIGGGLVWLVTESEDEGKSPGVADDQGAVAKAGGAIAHAKEAAGDAIGTAKDKLSEATHTVQQKVEHGAHSLAESSRATVATAREGLAHGIEAGTRKFSQAADDYPLAVGLAFAALGALVGLALPHTAKEDELMGAKSDALMDTAKEKGEELLEKGKEVGSRVLETVKHEAQEQGLTPAVMAEGIANLGEKGKEVVAKAKGEAARALEDEGIKPGPTEASYQDGQAGNPSRPDAV